jgi:hypothetical protein
MGRRMNGYRQIDLRKNANFVVGVFVCTEYPQAFSRG